MRAAPWGGISLAFAALTISGVRAQCPAWIVSPSEHANLRGSVRAMTTWAPPGSPTPLLFFGGSGIRFNGTPLSQVAQWNGFVWQPVGNGPDASVYALQVWNSPSGPVLVAGGSFEFVNGFQTAFSLARWNGTGWAPLGEGVSFLITSYPDQPGEIFALTTWDPDGPGPLGERLVVGGNFDYAGQQVLNTHNIAAFDGSNWHSFGLGIDDGRVDALTTWDPDGPGPQLPQLYAGGNFTTATNVICNGVARWANGSWSHLAGGLSYPGPSASRAEALREWDPDGPGPMNTKLVVAGQFDAAGGVPSGGIAAWNGTSWEGLDAGASGIWRALAEWDPDGAGPDIPRLIGSGWFGSAVSSPRIYNGSSWQPLGQHGAFQSSALQVWDQDGAGPLPPRLFSSASGHQTPKGLAHGVCELVESEWHAMNFQPQVFAATSFGGRIVLGGSFNMVGRYPSPTENIRNLAAWSGDDIGWLGEVDGAVRALKTYNTIGSQGGRHLVIGGAFGSAGGNAATRIARYFEPNFSGSPGWFAMGSGFNSTVLAIERFNNQVYAGGVFTSSGGTTVNRIARFDGTNWQPLGTGANETVRALKVYNGSLFVGGSFTSAGGLNSGGLARWDGTNWNIVGGNFLGTVHALEVWNNLLIIGGAYQGLNAPCIAAYNGTSYFNLGSGGTGSVNNPVYALAVGPDGHLYAGGNFSSIGGVQAANIARWNGSNWAPVDGGLSGGTVLALASYRNELHAGGEFVRSGPAQFLAPGWARFTVDGVPWIARHPDDLGAACVGGDPWIRAYPAPGYTHVQPVTYSWSKNGQPIVPGPTPWGSTVKVLSDRIEFENVQLQDEGVYALTFSNGCGSATSLDATFTICYANCDCSFSAPTLNVADFGCFLQRFAAGDPYANCDLSTASPTLNVADFGCFLQRFAAGCP